MTLDDYKLYTGLTSSYQQDEFDEIVAIAKLRLASFLCLDEFPELTEDNKDLAMLLANFIAGVFKYQGTPETVNSKSVRNFTISFNNSATNAFSNIYNQYQDIIDKYSECGLGVKVERSAYHGRRGGCCGSFGF